MRRSTGQQYIHVFAIFLLLQLANFVLAQTNYTCIPLARSQKCPNFSGASVSTSLIADFPFLQFVSTVEEFDAAFKTFIQQDYTKYHEPSYSVPKLHRKKYQEVMQCQGINLSNTTYLYARFTETVLCAQMVQESIQACSLSPQDSYVPHPS